MWQLSVPAKYGLPMGGGVAGATVASFAPVDLIDWLIDPKMAIAILIGIPLGIGWRVAKMMGERARRQDITRDFWVSVLISGANFCLAAFVAKWMGLDYLGALMASVVIAATGVKAIMQFSRWAWRQLLRGDIAELQGSQRNEAQKLKSAVEQALRDRDEARDRVTWKGPDDDD